MKRLITERDVLDASRKRAKKIFLTSTGTVTPAASDAARQRGIDIVRNEQPPTENFRESASDPAIADIVIGSDHGGFALKADLRAFLLEQGHRVEDVGTFSEESVDYPDYAFMVAERVSRDLTRVGIIIDGAGVGSAMTANKVPGIRAAACYDVYTAKNSREHNFANVLTLGSRVTGPDIARQIVLAWLATDFGEARHKRRVDKMMAVEKKYLRS